MNGRVCTLEEKAHRVTPEVVVGRHSRSTRRRQPYTSKGTYRCSLRSLLASRGRSRSYRPPASTSPSLPTLFPADPTGTSVSRSQRRFPTSRPRTPPSMSPFSTSTSSAPTPPRARTSV